MLLPVAAALIVFVLLVGLFVFRGSRGAVLGAFHFVFSGGAASSAPAAQLSAGTVNGRFNDPSLGFSFAVPSGYHAVRNLSDSGEMILVQPESASSSENDGVEVYVRSFDGTAADITVQNIETQAGLKVHDPIAISIAGAQGLGFLDISSNPPLYEAWFVQGGYLFQTLAWESNATLLKNVLASWQFN